MSKKSMMILVLIFAIFIVTSNSSSIINSKIIGPVLIEPVASLDIFNSGKISMYGIIKLGITDSDLIYVKGKGINYPQNNISSYIGINEMGQLITVSAPAIQLSDLVAGSQRGEFVSLGILNQNYFGFTSDSSDVLLNGLAPNANIYISSDSNIFLSSSSINIPNTGEYYNLAINDLGQLVSIDGGNPVLDGVFNNLRAAENPHSIITFGIPKANYFSFETGAGNFIINSLENFFLSASQGELNLSANQVKIEGKNVFWGSSADTNIEINENLTSTMKLNAEELLLNASQLQFGNQSLWPNDCSMSNYLMIDCNGYLTISCSSSRYKNDIKYLDELPDNYFNYVDLARACQFRYKNNYNSEKNVIKNLSFGYIAEDFNAQEDLKRFVIYNQDGEPMSIDYNSILVSMVYVLQKKLKQYSEKLIKCQLSSEQQAEEIRIIRGRLDILESQLHSLEKIKNHY